MAELPAFLLPHVVRAEPFTGEGSEGDTYGPVVVVQCRSEGWIDVTADGEHTGTVKVYTRMRYAPALNVGARVTLTSGRVGYVAAVAEHTDGGLGAWQHLEVSVQGGGR